MVTFGNIRVVLAILVTAMVVGIVVAISLKGSKQVPQAPILQKLPQNIDVALNQARFTEIREGAAVWELVAERALYDKSGEKAYLTGIRMKFPKTRSSGAITVTAARGEYHSTSSDVKLRGSVHLVTESGVTFDTAAIDYLASRSLFRTSEAVSFHHQRLALKAVGMEMDTREQQARFHRPVDAVVEGLRQPE